MTISIDRYGRGISVPFQRDGKGDFANKSGTDILSSDIKEVIGIIGPSGNEPGELAWDTEFGSEMHTLRHRNMGSELVQAMVEYFASNAVRSLNQSVFPSTTTIEKDYDNNTLRVTLNVKPVGSEFAIQIPITIEE